MTSVWGQRSCVNSCSLSLISRSAVHCFPSGSNEAHEFCLWAGSPFSAQLWPPRPLGSKHKQTRSRPSCETSVSVCFCLKSLIEEKCPNNAAHNAVRIPPEPFMDARAPTLADGLLLTFMSDFSVWNNLRSGAALSFPFSSEACSELSGAAYEGKVVCA